MNRQPQYDPKQLRELVDSVSSDQRQVMVLGDPDIPIEDLAIVLQQWSRIVSTCLHGGRPQIAGSLFAALAFTRHTPKDDRRWEAVGMSVHLAQRLGLQSIGASQIWVEDDQAWFFPNDAIQGTPWAWVQLDPSRP